MSDLFDKPLSEETRSKCAVSIGNDQMFLVLLRVCAGRDVEFEQLGVHSFVVREGETVSVNLSCSECVSAFLFETDEFEAVRLNGKIKLRDSHFLFDGSRVNVSVRGIKEVSVKVWLVPEHLCNSGASAFALDETAKLRINFVGNTPGLCVFPRNNYFDFKFTQFYDRNPGSAVTYVYTNSSLVSGEPYMSSKNHSLVDVSLDQPFFFTMDENGERGTIWALDTVMLKGNRVPWVCSFSESPRFFQNYYNASVSRQFEYLASCNQVSEAAWWFLVKFVLIAILSIALIVVLILEVCTKRKEESVPEELSSIRSQGSYTQSNRQFEFGKREEKVIFFQRAAGKLTPPSEITDV